MKKVMVVFGTRPEAIKLVPVIKELEKNTQKIRVIKVVTAQHRQMLDQVLKVFNITTDYDLNIMKKKQNLSQITTLILQKLDRIIEKEKPDIMLVQGDTTTAFSAALSAFYHKVNIGHIEAGLRTYDKFNPYPEEINRKLVTAIADLHFAPTVLAYNNLLKENVPKNKIYITGNTVIDALFMTLKQKYEFDIPFLKKFDFSKKKTILVTVHRRENWGMPLQNICKALKIIVSSSKDAEVIFPVHYNPIVRGTVQNILKNESKIHLIDPLEYQPFVHLMNRAYLILTDSGGIQEEAPSLGKPVLVLRKITERPEAVQSGTVKIVGDNINNIVKETIKLLSFKAKYKKMSCKINTYGDGKAASKIVKIIIHKLC